MVPATSDSVASVCYAAIGNCGYDPPKEHELCDWAREGRSVHDNLFAPLVEEAIRVSGVLQVATAAGHLCT